jgi:hypothetical protein
LRTKHRIVRTPSGPEAVARIREGRVKQRLQDLQQGLLDEPERMLVEVTDYEIIEIDAAAWVTTDHGIVGHRVPP